MRFRIKMILIGVLFLAVACGLSANEKQLENSKQELVVSQNKKFSFEGLYANEHGEIEIRYYNDSLVNTIFRNNVGDKFDTLMQIKYADQSIFASEDFPFLQLKMGGIKVCQNRISVYEFSSYYFLSQFIQIDHLYDRPFYKINEEISIQDVILRSEHGETIDGIYISPSTSHTNKTVDMKGVVKREKYIPSKNNFTGGDIAKQYRLIIKPNSTKLYPTYQYTGTSINCSGNKACIVWEFADSEAYVLENKALWSEEEIGKVITVEGTLIQNEFGSFIKNWQIIPD